VNAEIIAVGSEMLTPQRVDTNSLYLTDQLNALGIEVIFKCVVGDDRALMAATIRTAIERSGLVILSGGLGPTEDDVTRDAVAEALGRPMRYDEAIFEGITAMFARLGRKVAENNKRQAMVIEGAEVLPNDRGTAPGLWIPIERGGVLLLPGPPRELTNLWEKQARARIEAITEPKVIRTRWLRVAGMGESDLDQLIAPVYTKYVNPATTILAKMGDVEVHLRARCETAEEAEALLAEVAPPIEALLGDRIYSRNGDPLETAVGHLLRDRGATAAVAESCTGGLLGARFTDAPGSSAWFRGGYLVYNADLKRALIGEFTEDPVSEPVALRLAAAAASKAGATYGVSVTGIAGPDGGTEENPVGTVWIGVAGPQGAEAKRFRFPGERSRVRTLAATYALDRLRQALIATQI
jgi:nicotinamide-nucleotide amidase